MSDLQSNTAPVLSVKTRLDRISNLYGAVVGGIRQGGGGTRVVEQLAAMRHHLDHFSLEVSDAIFALEHGQPLDTTWEIPSPLTVAEGQQGVE